MSELRAELLLGMAILTVLMLANVAFFFANLKIYTEIMKEKAQRSR